MSTSPEEEEPLLTPEMAYQPPPLPSAAPSHDEVPDADAAMAQPNEPFLTLTIRTIPLLRLVALAVILPAIVVGTKQKCGGGIVFVIILYLLLLWTALHLLLVLVKFCGGGGNMQKMQLRIGAFGMECGWGVGDDGEARQSPEPAWARDQTPGKKAGGRWRRRWWCAVVDAVFGVLMFIAGMVRSRIWFRGKAMQILCFVIV